MSWDYRTFGEWLRVSRIRKLPVISQQAIADRLGVPQSLMSRWEKEKPNTRAPSLEECSRLADIFDVNFIDLARLCGQWNDELERSVLVALAKGSDLRNALVAQLAEAA